MAIVKTNNQYYTDIANAIRSKNGTNTTYKPSEMADEIDNINVKAMDNFLIEYFSSRNNNFSYCFCGINDAGSEVLTLIDFSSLDNINFYFAFSGSSQLSIIPAINVSNVINMQYLFRQCFSLKSILMYGMKVNFDISSSSKFETSDLVTILNNLATVTTSTTLTMGSTNLAKLSDAQKAIATNKGWTLA